MSAYQEYFAACSQLFSVISKYYRLC